MRMIVLGAAAVVLAAFAIQPGAARAESSPDYSGDYRMQGKGFSASDAHYEGTCSLRRDNTSYRVSCYNSDTRHTYVGKGLAAGDTLSIFIGDLLQGDHNALFAGEYLVVYRRRADGVLDGTWVHAASAAAGAETLVPQR
jgi:hypothetical protein